MRVKLVIVVIGKYFLIDHKKDGFSSNNNIEVTSAKTMSMSIFILIFAFIFVPSRVKFKLVVGLD